MFHPVQGAKIVQAIAPQANGSAVNGDYIKFRDAALAFIIIQMAQGNAAQATISIEKATGDGVGNTAITNAVPIWSNLDCAANDTLVKRADAVNYQLDAALKNKMVVFQVDPSSLGEGYGWGRVVVGASNAANIVSAEYMLVGIRYKQETPPSAVA
jgi:hypothetical protein